MFFSAFAYILKENVGGLLSGGGGIGYVAYDVGFDCISS